MSSGNRKLWRQVILRSVGAVFFGWAIVSVLVLLLSDRVSSEAVPVKKPVIQAVKFPENEQMLDDAAARLAHDGAVLSKVEPAAGSAKKINNK